MSKRKGEPAGSDDFFVELVPCTCLSIPCCCDLESDSPDEGQDLSVGEEFAVMRRVIAQKRQEGRLSLLTALAERKKSLEEGKQPEEAKPPAEKKVQDSKRSARVRRSRVRRNRPIPPQLPHLQVVSDSQFPDSLE